MPTFRVRLQGANLLMRDEAESEPRRYGFYVNRVVEALNSNEAGRIAIASVLSEPKLQRAKLNTVDDPFSCWVDDIGAMRGGSLPAKQQGFVFFPEQPEE